MTNEQMAMQASALLNNKGGALSGGQEAFANDILSSYQMLMQLSQWETEFKAGGPSPETPGQLKNPVDSPKLTDSQK